MTKTGFSERGLYDTGFALFFWFYLCTFLYLDKMLRTSRGIGCFKVYNSVSVVSHRCGIFAAHCFLCQKTVR
jgi:hypothetical protein